MKAKVITGIILVLFLTSILSITPTVAVKEEPGMSFKGKVNRAWHNPPPPQGEWTDAHGIIIVSFRNGKAKGFASFWVPEFKESIRMKLVNLGYLVITEEYILFDGTWAVWINGELQEYQPYRLMDIYPDEFELYPPYSHLISGKTLSYKTWGLDMSQLLDMNQRLNMGQKT